MVNYSYNGITAALTRRKRTANDDDRMRTIYWRVAFKKRQVYYSTGLQMDLKEWNDFQERGLLKHKDTKDILRSYFDKTLKPAIDGLAVSNSFTFEALDQILGRSDIVTVNDAFQDKIGRLVKADRIGNSTIYKTVRNSLESFKGKNIPFSAITVSFLKKYEKHLADRGVKTATISLYMRTLRAVVNNEGRPYLKDEAYPFGRGKYVPKTSKGVKINLTLKQVHAIENFECGDSLTGFCRDLWIFSFYGSGINFTDIFRMKYSDIIIGELTFVRYKTRNTRNDETYISVPVLEPMKRVIKKHGNKSTGGYIFPLLNGSSDEIERRKRISNITRDCNKRVKIICRELKNDDGTLMIPDYNLVDNYTARHSYSTILNKMGVPESFTSQQLGHSVRTITQGYFGAFDRDARFKYNSLLLNPGNEDKIKFMNVI